MRTRVRLSDRVGDRPPADLGERRAEQDGAEHEEAQGRQHVAGLLGEPDHARRPHRGRHRGRRRTPPHDAEGEPGDPGGDEAAAAERDGDAVAERGDAERRHLAPLVAHPSAARGPGQQAGPGEPDGETHRGAEPERQREDLGRARAGRVSRRPGEQHHEEGQRDPVVQPALDVEPPPDRRRDPRVGDGGLPEGRVGRRQDDREERQFPHGEARQQEPGAHRPEDHGQREPQPQEPERERVVAPQLRPPDGAGVGEQDRHEGHLEQQFHRTGVPVQVQQVETDRTARPDRPRPGASAPRRGSGPAAGRPGRRRPRRPRPQRRPRHSRIPLPGVHGASVPGSGAPAFTPRG